MAVTLAQAALLTQNDLQRGVIQIFRREGMVLDRIPLLEIEGNAYAYNSEATLPGVEFRAVNSSYSESTGTVNQLTESLCILGGDADVDNFIVKTRSNLNDQRAIQTAMKVKAAVFKYQDSFINGDTAVDANSFDGLKKRLTGSQVIDAAPAGLPILGDGQTTTMQLFFDKLDELIASVIAGVPDALYMNRQVLQKVRSAARRLLILSTTRDEFGRLIDTYQGIPLLDIGIKPPGQQVILNTEDSPDATVHTCSSIYAVKFGANEADQAVTGLTNGGVQVVDLGELEIKPAYRTRIEFYTGLAVFGRGAARLRGVLPS